MIFLAFIAAVYVAGALALPRMTGSPASGVGPAVSAAGYVLGAMYVGLRR